MVKHVTSEELEELVKGDKPVVCDFWATWCGPCRMLAPVMEQVSEELSDRATFVKIDVDDNPDLAREYSIMSIPCVMVFKNGELAGKNVGFGAKAAMKEFIEKYI